MISKREWDVLDRFTKMDEKVALLAQEQARTTKVLEEIKNLLTGVRPPAIPRVEVPREIEPLSTRLDEIKEMLRDTITLYTDFFYFSYPADGTRKTVSKGRTVIDFYEGKVKLPDGTEEYLSDSLKAHSRTFARSFGLEVNKDAIYALDDRGRKPIYADDFHAETYQKFQRVILETTEDTRFIVYACTNPEAFMRKLSPIAMRGIINSYDRRVDPLSEFGDPKTTMDIYSGTATSYQTLVSMTVTTGYYGVLNEVSMTEAAAARYQLTIGGTVQFVDKKIVANLTIPFPPNKLPTGTQVLLEVKSADGSSIEVNGEIAWKEVLAS